MKKTNENTKVTLTFEQLKRLVKESNEQSASLEDIAEFLNDAIANYFSVSSAEPDKYGFAFDVKDGSFLDFISYWDGKEYRLSDIRDLGSDPVFTASKITQKHAGSLPAVQFTRIDKNGGSFIDID